LGVIALLVIASLTGWAGIGVAIIFHRCTAEPAATNS